MRRVLIFVNGFRRLDENHALFANTFRRRGWEVWLGSINSLATHRYQVDVEMAPVENEVEIFGALDSEVRRASAEDFDLVWVMKSPHERLARDAWQILWALSQRIPFANSVEGILFLNNKNNLGLIVPPAHLVENHVANEFDGLWNICKSGGGTWVVKPTNQDCGASVFLMEPEGRNARALLQSMTGNSGKVAAASAGDPRGLQNQYCVLQRYAPQILQGEKRVILAAGRVVSQHGRIAAAGEHRSNIAQGGTAFPVELTTEESELCALVADRLANRGVLFAGIDVCYPYVLEINMINPGGLDDVLTMTGQDLYGPALDRILERIQLPADRRGSSID